MPVNNTVLCLQFCSVCRMGLTDTVHTVLREISDLGGKAKQEYTANFILTSLAGLIKSRKLK